MIRRPPRSTLFPYTSVDLGGRRIISAEAQLASIADDIPYHTPDLDARMRAGLFGPDDIAHLPVVGAALAQARRASLDVPPPRLRHETIRRVINVFVTDLIEETRRRITALDPASADAIRRAKRPMVAFTAQIDAANRAIKEFLHARMYKHWRVNRMTAKTRRVTEELFRLLHADTSLLPDGWRTLAGEGDAKRAALVVADYIAG